MTAGELDDLANEAADDALVAVLTKLDFFRGKSRFSTWASKFVLLEAAVKARRRARHGKEIPLDDGDEWLVRHTGPSVQSRIESHAPLSARRRRNWEVDVSTDDADRALIARLLGPPGPEVTCEACFELLDEYVDAELAGEDADARLPGMRVHLEGCPACREDQASLRAIAMLDTRLR